MAFLSPTVTALISASLVAAGISAAAEQAPRVTSDSSERITAYLSERMPLEIGRVSVTADQVIIRGKNADDVAELKLAEVPMERLLSDPDRWVETFDLKPAASGDYEIRLPRKVERNGQEHDRLLSKWQLIHRQDGNTEPLSHARYADDIACRQPDLPEAKLASKKGLGGWSADREPRGELNALGISAVTVNLMVQEVISVEPMAGASAFSWEGRTFYARENQLARYDATFQEAARHGAMVSVILLVPNPAKGGDATTRQLAHPDATAEGIFAMPNLVSPEGFALYSAAMNLMAERWSRPNGEHGRVHHWIIHNEVDAGWTWTNCGVKEAAAFLDLYHRSLRISHLIARQYDPHAKAYVSLTHHWTATAGEHCYPSRTLVEMLAAYGKAEGNFAWGLAYHPYPQDLFNPRTWEDSDATVSFDTRKITPRNLEVLDAYFRQLELAGPDGKSRSILLSENGFNSRDYSEKSLREQAAGMAFAWKKISTLKTIDAWLYHNWIDNRGEGGLKIGLRKFPDEPGHELEPKPIWQLYQALGTEREDGACAPYLPVVGIGKWSEIQHGYPPQ